jgi:hypothetical protein
MHAYFCFVYIGERRDGRAPDSGEYVSSLGEDFVTALRKLLAPAVLGLMALPAAAQTPPAPRNAYILIVDTDLEKDAIPRGNLTLDRVQGGIADELKSRGFHVFEAAILKDVLGGRLPREPSDLVEAARLPRVPIDVIIVTQITAKVRPLEMAHAYKPFIHVAVRMMSARSGELVGRYDFGDDLDLPPMPESCATSRECLLDTLGSQAPLIGSAVGNAVATKLAAHVRFNN